MKLMVRSRSMTMRRVSDTPGCRLAFMAPRSLRRDAEVLDDPAPLVGVALRQCAQLVGREPRDLDGDLLHPLFHVGQEQDAADLGVEPADDILRHAGRTERA